MTPLLLACPLSSACGTARRSRTPEEGAKMSGRGKRKSRSARQGCDAKRPQVAPLSSVPGDALAQDVERLYRLRMPPDFYHLWEFCGRRNPQSPQDALGEAGLRLVGPYDILAGRHRSAQNREPNYFLHWRYFYDPPELQTVLVVLGESQQHLGYYRDSPDDLPAFIGENEAAKGCQITQMGDNVFAAVLLLLERRRRRRRRRREPAGRKHNASLLPLEEELRTAAKALGYSLEQKSKGMKLRAKKVVAPTFHGAGIVVPVDKNDVGYRELPETDAALKRICQSIVDAGDDAERLKAFAPLQEMTTLVQFANDECDYGMGYELGVDLFCFGSHYLYKVVLQLLPLAYSLLKRSLFGEILEAHLSSRSRDTVDQLEQLCS
uniref:Histone PARylation factor 1 n=1 Tax=Scleropages formosus TaxID=113540 RepID=A0A8C9V1D3_SCLFO